MFPWNKLDYYTAKWDGPETRKRSINIHRPFFMKPRAYLSVFAHCKWLCNHDCGSTLMRNHLCSTNTVQNPKYWVECYTLPVTVVNSWQLMVPHWAVGKETEVFYLILNKTTTISHSIIFSNSLLYVTPEKEMICDAFALRQGSTFCNPMQFILCMLSHNWINTFTIQNRIQNRFYADVFAYSDIEDDEPIPQEITFWLAAGDINWNNKNRVQMHSGLNEWDIIL